MLPLCHVTLGISRGWSTSSDVALPSRCLSTSEWPYSLDTAAATWLKTNTILSHHFQACEYKNQHESLRSVLRACFHGGLCHTTRACASPEAKTFDRCVTNLTTHDSFVTPFCSVEARSFWIILQEFSPPRRCGCAGRSSRRPPCYAAASHHGNHSEGLLRCSGALLCAIVRLRSLSLRHRQLRIAKLRLAECDTASLS